MYRPPAFDMPVALARELCATHPLAQLVVSAPDGLVATPVPLRWRREALVGHLARPNSLWLHPGPALAIFTGPQGYISPNWYPSKREHGKVVPTWNYSTVHVHGTLVVHDDDEWKREVLALLTDTFEAASPMPWKITDAPDDYLAGAITRVVGIELVDVRIEGKAKLSQNRDEADVAGVIEGMGAGSPTQQAVADAMRAATVPHSGT